MQLSQQDSSATSDLCNKLLGTLACMMDTMVDLSRISPNTDSLRLISGLMTWCHDAHDAVVEIKSRL